ncbi:MAG: phosphoribosylamine--glycine ligase [bacterium]
MKILVIGSGGREHAIIYSILRSRKNVDLYCAPGNGGISDNAKIVNIKYDDIDGLLNFALSEKIDLTVVGPEVPLSLGIADKFLHNGLKVFGPGQKAALLESSKQFTKEFLKRNNIKTADYQSFTDFKTAYAYIQNRSHPVVIKASGLAAGKGVFIPQSIIESENYLDLIFNKKIFGKSGETVVIEDYLEGFELSYMIAADGKTYKPLATSMDYKKAYDGDKGENTGGMGSISPHPYLSAALEEKIKKNIIEPVLLSLKNEGIIYKGILYAGLMIKDDDIYVLEFNVRFGDPETQSILIRLKSDIVGLFESCIDGTLNDYNLEFDNNQAVCLVLSSAGYPGKYETGYEISFGEYEKYFNYSGNNLSCINKDKDICIFHAGTKKIGNKYFTNGGRVLNICSKNKDLKTALSDIYNAADAIQFKNKYYRRDIGNLGISAIKV